MSDLNMTRGDTLQFDLTFNGLVSLSDCALRWAAKRSYSDDTALISKSLSSGIEDISQGQTVAARVTVDPVDTDHLGAPLVLVWDAELTTGDGAVYTIAAGKLVIAPDVAR